MANYTVQCSGNDEEGWKAVVTYKNPKPLQQNAPPTQKVEFSAEYEKDLANQLNEFLITINNNIPD